MSDSDDPSALERAKRTVTPPYRGRPDAEMTAIGYALFLGVVVLLVPLLPFLVIVWFISKLTEKAARRAPVGEE